MTENKKQSLSKKRKGHYHVLDERVLHPEKLEETVALSKRIVLDEGRDGKEKKEREAGMPAFIFGQMRFISKGIWAVKAVVFGGMLAALYGFRFGGNSGAGEMMAIGASMLVLTAMPEIWKNIRYQALDVESCTRFGLKKAYFARFFILGMTDLCLATVFVACADRWLAVSFYRLAVWLLVPYNSTLIVCLSLMAFGKRGSEQMAEAGGALWMAAIFWLTGYLHIYEKVQLLIWGILLGLSYVYLLFVIGKIVKNANGILETEYMKNGGGIC